MQLSQEIEAAARAKKAAIAAELSAADAALDRATESSALILRALSSLADGLSDADAVLLEAALIASVRSSADAVKGRCCGAKDEARA